MRRMLFLWPFAPLALIFAAPWGLFALQLAFVAALLLLIGAPAAKAWPIRIARRR